jgi:hypothetical protein
MNANNSLAERAADALRHSPIPVLRRVTVEQSSNTLILHGRVPSYYYKQLAQEAVLPHLAGQPLQNDLEVIRS